MPVSVEKSADAFRTISEVALELALPQHVLRFWETRFAQIKPMKRGGGRRYYRPDDVELLKGIRHLLYADGYTIKGVQRLLKDFGAKAVANAAKGTQFERPSSTEPDDDLDGDLRDLTAFASADEKVGAAVASPSRQQPESTGLCPDDRRRLQSMLEELEECERVLTAAMQN